MVTLLPTSTRVSNPKPEVMGSPCCLRSKLSRLSFHAEPQEEFQLCLGARGGGWKAYAPGHCLLPRAALPSKAAAGPPEATEHLKCGQSKSKWAANVMKMIILGDILDCIK